MPYPARAIPFDPRDFATHQSLQRISAFDKGGGPAARQTAIDYVVKAHAFSKDHTKSLLYTATLNQPGRNIGGNIGIGPPAFDQDLAWLAGVVFHELVHSPQHAYYVSKGLAPIDPKRSETERRLIALDEYEAYSWSLKRRAELALSQAQQVEIRRRAALALIDLDEPKAQNLARGQRFDAARDELIRQYSATGNRTAIPPRGPSACCSV